MKAILNKFKAMPESVKATLVFAIASFATSGINYITTPIFTRLLSGAEYGTVAVYNSWYSIVRVFASMTLIFPGILNVGLYEHSENRWKYLSTMLGITTVSTAVLTVLYACFPGLFQGLLGLNGSLMALMLFSCFALPATTFWTMKQKYEYRYQVTFFVSVGSAVLAQAVAVAAVIAVPIAVWACGKYLERFAYRIDRYAWIIAVAVLLTLAMAFRSVLWQTLRAARTNPARALKAN